MSDYNSSLPVRTENAGDVIAKIADATTPSQQLAVGSDGSINVTDNGGSLTVDGTVTVTATNLDIRDLSASQDNVAISDGTDTLAVNADGSINVSFSTDKNYGTVGANTLRTASQIGNATGAADFNAGATGAQTLRTVGNQGDPNTVANSWPIKITDGTDTASITASSELQVLATAQPGVDIGDITINNGSGAGAVNIQDGGNSITIDGTVTVSNLPTTVDTNYGTVGASTIRTASQIGNATGAANFGNGATGAQTLRVAANLALSGTDVSSTNPIPVSISADNAGTEVNDYNTGAAVAANATSTHDYTVTALKTLLLTQIEASASGKAKIEVRIETAAGSGTFNTKFVQFNSTAETNMSILLQSPISVVAGARVRVIRTNRDNQAQDLYSTICGQEV